MAINDAAIWVQQKISAQFPSITKEHVYAASYVVTTVALTALSYYAPVTFFLAGGPLAFAQVFCFSKAARELDPSQHNVMKAWMATACLVAAAYLTVQITYFIPFLSWGLQSMKYIDDLSFALMSFGLFTGAIGFGGGAVKKLYQRGLELAQTEDWKPMQAFMENSANRARLSEFFDKIGFGLGMFDPNAMSHIVSKKVRSILFKFLPEDQKEQQFQALMKDYQEIAPHFRQEANLLWPSILEYVTAMPIQKQLTLLPQLISMRGQDVLRELPPETVTALRRRVLEVEVRNQNFIQVCIRRSDELYRRIDGFQDPKTEEESLDQISLDFTQLRNDINQHIADVNLYAPRLKDTLRGLQPIQKELMTGRQYMKLQQLNSQRAGEDEFDGTDPTWNYFLAKYSKFKTVNGVRADEGLAFVNRLCAKLEVSQQELDGKLIELEIGTIGEFVVKALGGNRALLANPEEVYARFEEYVDSKGDARNLIYGALAGKAITHGSNALDLGSKAVYKASMIFTAVAPILMYPTLFTIGFTASATYNSLSFIARRVDSLLEGWLGLVVLRYQFFLGMITRRPFITLLSTAPTNDMTAYAASDTLGKMRILAMEFAWGWFLSVLSFDRDGNLPGVGGLLTGMAAGREASHLASRAWRHIRSSRSPSREVAI